VIKLQLSIRFFNRDTPLNHQTYLSASRSNDNVVFADANGGNFGADNNEFVRCQFHQYFYKQLFHTKMLWAPFMWSQFGFVIFRRKNISPKAACKLLMKLTTVRLRDTKCEQVRIIYNHQSIRQRSFEDHQKFLVHFV